MSFQEHLEKHYHLLYKDSLKKIEEQGFEHDLLIDSDKDKRFGLTLLFRPSHQVKTAIQGFIEKIQKVESIHYFYPNSDIHVTVMPIISCYEGFYLDQIQHQEYIDLLVECLYDLPVFRVHFRGVTLSPSCIMIQGFPTDDTLEQVRDRLRVGFKGSPLDQSLDKRYPLKTAHSTVVRFKEAVRHPQEILSLIRQFRGYEFGSCKVEEMELVFNDWYQRECQVKRLFSFRLG